MRAPIMCLALALFVLPAVSWSQQTSGDVEGRVVAQDGTPLAGVPVSLLGTPPLPTRTLTTDGAGHFRFTGVDVGLYSISIRAMAYRPVIVQEVRVQLGRTIALGTLRLESQAIELPELVVSGGRSQIDPSSASRGANLPDSVFERLPTDRDFRSMVGLVAQANPSYYPGDDANIAGSTGPETAYYVDGVHMTDPFRAGISSMLPYNFIEEVRVRTGGYEAEYGRSQSGAVDVITHSGTKTFHAQLFGFYTGDGLSSASTRGYADLRIENSHDYDIGGLAAGPLARDRLFYSLAYNPRFQRRDVELSGLGANRATRTSHLLAGKLDWKADELTDLTLTVLGDPSRESAVGVWAFGNTIGSFASTGPFFKQLEEGSISASLRARRVMGRNFALQAATYTQWRHANEVPDPDRGLAAPQFMNLATGEVSGGYGVSITDESRRTGAVFRGTATLGPHLVKAGFEYEENATDDRWDARFPGLGFVYAIDDTTYFAFNIYKEGNARVRVATVFLQDSWQVTEAVRLNGGMRWDGQYLIDPAGQTAQSITDQFQPRLGLIWRFGADRHKLSASFGRFYEQMPTFLGSAYHTGGYQGLVFYDHDPRVDPVGGDSLLTPYVSPGKIAGLRGQHYDEATLGYEFQVARAIKLGLGGTYRQLREVIEDAVDPVTGEFTYGNPGRGNLAFLPKASHIYRALELSAEGTGPGRAQWFASYVLSRSVGNYLGFYDPAQAAPASMPNAGLTFDNIESVPNSNGLLANDRTHVFKMNASAPVGRIFLVGATLLWASGSPLSELGMGSTQVNPIFLRRRGSAGRLPSIYDLNLRASWKIPARLIARTRLQLDMFHIGNPRKPVAVQELRFLAVDESGNQILENPNYLRPTIYQPPFAVRLGLIVDL